MWRQSTLLFDCPSYTLNRIILLDKLSAYEVDIDLKLLPFGDQSMSIEDNIQIVEAVHEYIKNSERFV